MEEEEKTQEDEGTQKEEEETKKQGRKLKAPLFGTGTELILCRV